MGCAFHLLSYFPEDACGAAVHNPCAVGTCVNDGKGSCSCVCPPGFRQGTTVDGTFSCGPGDSSSTYTVVSWGVMCADIHPVYGLTLAHLQQQNPGLSCSAPLVVGMVVNVVEPESLTPCSVYYTTSQLPIHCSPPPFSPPLLLSPPLSHPCESLATYFSLTSPPATPRASPHAHLMFFSSPHPCFALLPPCSIHSSSRPPSSHQGDTCESLAAYFSLSRGCPFQVLTCAAAFQVLNPGLDCSGSGELVGSQAVCVERRAESAAVLLIPVCSQLYLVQAGETCDQIRSVPSPPLSPLEFFRLNPGIKCSRLVPKTDVGSITGFEACIGSSFSFTQGVCPKTRAYVVGTGDR
ncbi:unnamed protein product [Closterium sp. NIES-64]|nr:unnamed protein product [Closterium sp. NIES-64]CAI5977931.1 unnamed protein product [Closterium sp. NIES-65]